MVNVFVVFVYTSSAVVIIGWLWFFIRAFKRARSWQGPANHNDPQGGEK